MHEVIRLEAERGPEPPHCSRTGIYFLGFSCRIKEDTKMRLWFAQNTVLLYDECFRDLNLKTDTPNEKWKIAFSKQKKICEKYRAKLNQLIEMCSTEIPASLSHPNAPSGDPDFTEVQDNLQKICSVVMMAKSAQDEQENQTKIPPSQKSLLIAQSHKSYHNPTVCASSLPIIFAR